MNELVRASTHLEMPQVVSQVNRVRGTLRLQSVSRTCIVSDTGVLHCMILYICFVFRSAAVKQLCDTMKSQILSRAFYGCEFSLRDRQLIRI